MVILLVTTEGHTSSFLDLLLLGIRGAAPNDNLTSCCIILGASTGRCRLGTKHELFSSEVVSGADKERADQ